MAFVGKDRINVTPEKARAAAGRGLMVTAGSFLLNLVIAVFGTTIVELPFERYTVVTSPRESLFLMDILTGCLAFGFGYVVFRTWRPVASKWVWVAGLLWFVQRALVPPDGVHVLSWELSATKSVFVDWAAMAHWGTYTLPCVRAVFYSAGALSSSRIGDRKAPVPR
jgi:hypothetical protein